MVRKECTWLETSRKVAHRDLQLIVSPLPRGQSLVFFLSSPPSLYLRLLRADSLVPERFRVLTKANESGKCSAPPETRHGISFIFSFLKGRNMIKENNEIGSVPLCFLLIKEPWKGFFFKLGAFFGGALFPCFSNFGKIKSGVCFFQFQNYQSGSHPYTVSSFIP